MFKNAKVNDRVYDIKYKWGIINKINSQFIFVKFDNNYNINLKYDFSGRENGYLAKYFGQTLFWGEPEFEIPKKPFDLKKFFKENFVNYGDMNDEKYRLEYKDNETWEFIKDTRKTVVGAYYFIIDSAYTPEELSNILNENKVKFIEISLTLSEIWG